MKQTGILFFPAFDWSISPTHPEREERLLYTRDQIFEEGIMDFPQIREYHPQMASLQDIARVHVCVPDVKSHITDAHLIAAGSSILLADEILKGEIHNGFSIVRPPGHHSMTVTHGNRGFCNINNEAIMVEHIRKKYGIRKIAIVDTDVHHGDGTQEIFWHDPDVLFISFHQDGRTLYPGTGFANEAGGPLAYGSTLNIPLLPQTTDQGILYVLEQLVLPVLVDFQPAFLVNSAGQDNHYTDPLADMGFTARGYAKLNELLKPDIAVLEGGYSVQTALPYVNMALIMAMAGIDYSALREPSRLRAPKQEPPGNLTYLQKLTEKLWDMYQHREEQIELNRRRMGNIHKENKRIFYDTDAINELQERTIHLCPQCLGWQNFDSQASTREDLPYHIDGVSIPLYACDACRQEAYDRYHQIKETGKYERVYLQDKKADHYRYTDRRSQTEVIL